MGNLLTKFCNPLSHEKKFVLLVGAEGSGKTTLLYSFKLKPGWEQNEMNPTCGYNYEECNYNDVEFGVFDTPGKESLFPVVKHIYKNIKISGLVFVFKPSRKPSDYLEAKRKLKYLASEPTLNDCPIVVVANLASEIESQFRDEEFLKQALGFQNLNHLDESYKKLFVINAKFAPKESEKVFKALSNMLED